MDKRSDQELRRTTFEAENSDEDSDRIEARERFAEWLRKEASNAPQLSAEERAELDEAIVEAMRSVRPGYREIDK